MKILSIETSCDDTCISIFDVKGGTTNATFKVLANASNSQIPIHIPYGGVYPVLAKREHAKNLPIILEAVLKQAKLSKKEKITRRGGPVDAVMVTYGPGLEMCLWEGITFAKELAKKWSAGRRNAIPLIPTNHMEGHVLSVFGRNKGKFEIPKIKTPALSLLVSGGHTQLVLMKKWMQYEIIGATLDDAVGEAFDKVARMLDLPYPGGQQISKLAEELREKEKQDFQGLRRTTGPRTEQIFQKKNRDPEKLGFSFSKTPESLFPFSLPRPMLHSKDFNFSFSGLKTAVLYLVRDLGGIEKMKEETKAQIALEFENAAIECLVHKTKKAIEKYGVKTLIVAGGVAANQHLRNEMKKITIPTKKQKGVEIKILFP